jgi:hypothetical protein
MHHRTGVRLDAHTTVPRANLHDTSRQIMRARAQTNGRQRVENIAAPPAAAAAKQAHDAFHGGPLCQGVRKGQTVPGSIIISLRPDCQHRPREPAEAGWHCRAAEAEQRAAQHVRHGQEGEGVRGRAEGQAAVHGDDDGKTGTEIFN